MKKAALMTLGSLVFSFMIVMAAYACESHAVWRPAPGAMNSGSSDSFSGSSSNFENQQERSAMDQNSSSSGMSSDQDRSFGVSPDYGDSDYNLRSDEGMSSDQDRSFGVSPDYNYDFQIHSDEGYVVE